MSAFLSEVAGALSSLPFERLDTEKRVLRTEAGGDEGSFLARLLERRFGAATYLGLDEAVAEIERRVAPELFVPLEDRSAQVERVAETLTAPWTVDDELFMPADVLAEDERLVDMICAGHEKARGLLAVTSSRTLFLHNGDENRSSEHPHEQTRSVKRRGGFLPERLTLETADGKVVFTSFSPERRFPEFAAALEELATAS